MSDFTHGKGLFTLRDIWRMLGLAGEAKVGMHRCPGHADSRASLSVFEGRDGSGLRWKCHAGCGGGDGVDLYAMMKGCSRNAALRILLNSSEAIVGSLCEAITRRTRKAVCPERPRPVFRFCVIGTEARIARLSELRGIPLAGVMLANRRGLLAFGNHEGHSCWAVLDSTRLNIQVRRMSGEPWWGGAKSHTLRNSRAGNPLGIQESSGSDTVHLVEGGPDLVAAHAVICQMADPAAHAAVGMLGASMRPSRSLLAPLKGKDVIIWAHSDPAGAAAAESWRRALLGLARSVVTVRAGDILPDHKDLNELVASRAGMRALLAWMREVGHA